MIRVIGGRKQMMVFVGPWCGAFNWAKSARYGNGSRWFSGWHRYADDPDWE